MVYHAGGLRVRLMIHKYFSNMIMQYQLHRDRNRGGGGGGGNLEGFELAAPPILALHGGAQPPKIFALVSYTSRL